MKAFRGEVQIPRRSADLSVPHKFLNGGDIYAVLQKMGGEAVPEGVDAAAMGYLRLHAGFGVDLLSGHYVHVDALLI